MPATDAAARNDAAFDTARELDAWSRHALAANGFGAPEAARAARAARLDGLAAAAHTARASLAQILGVMVEALADQWRRHVHGPLSVALARRRRRRAIARTAATLSQLDPRTLRDIGLTASEAASIAAEAHGAVETTRQRLLHPLHLYGR
ncbi:MAG TPA: DUF1127 domain-containing protein [Burkholderiaceae bacterium]|nr:DUF1127 domain-containing protein [Burkholderiaceae bacterium]